MAEGTYDLDSYTWIVVLGGILSVCAAFGIGANDVANAYATSVGSGALSIKSAVILAGIFEFLGATFLGSHVSDTIRKKIADYDCFEASPDLLMYGCMCVIFVVALWLLVASALELPVSTTHSAVGGMIGMTMVAKGAGCVVWEKEAGDFPFVKGVSAIVISWVLSPVFSGIFAAAIFFLTRTFVLRAENSYNRAFNVYFIFIAGAIIINTFFIIYKGAKGLGLNDTSMETSVAISFGLGFGVALIAQFAVVPKLRAAIDEGREISIWKKADGKEVVLDVEQLQSDTNEDGTKKTLFKRMSDHMTYSLNADSKKIIEEDETVGAIHENAEVFDEKTEKVFQYLQVLTAICDSFAHGANDVANAIGPYAAIYIIWKSGKVEKKADMGADAYWILALGGLGIVLGLALYGYKILHALGTKIAKLSPSRGYSIELGAALVIIIGSRQGWPLSTTHCQVGATSAVAWMEGSKGVNYKLLGKVVLGWILTLVIVGSGVALVFASGVYAPTVQKPLELIVADAGR